MAETRKKTNAERRQEREDIVPRLNKLMTACLVRRFGPKRDLNADDPFREIYTALDALREIERLREEVTRLQGGDITAPWREPASGE